MASNAVRSSFACFISVVFPFFMFSTFSNDLIDSSIFVSSFNFTASIIAFVCSTRTFASESSFFSSNAFSNDDKAFLYSLFVNAVFPSSIALSKFPLLHPANIKNVSPITINNFFIFSPPIYP